jgi:transcriptional regulator with XRE-family HTH domain
MSKIERDDKLKREVMILLASGKQQNEVARQMGISVPALSRWMKKQGYVRVARIRWELEKEVE